MQLVRLKGISKRAKKPLELTVEESEALIERLPDPYRTVVIVAICTGLRVSEILALRWSRIRFDRLTMLVKVKSVNTIRQKGKPKTFRGRPFVKSDSKKAIVTLVEGYQIDITTGL